MVSRVSEYFVDQDELTQARANAEYWRQSMLDEMRIGRKERYAAAWFGFACGVVFTVLIAVAMG